MDYRVTREIPVPTMLFLPWVWTDEPRTEKPLLFASRFDGTGLRQGWRLLTGGIRLYFAVLRAPGALGASVRAHPLSGRYYTLSLWKDEKSLLAFAHGPAHRKAVTSLAELGRARGVLASRLADPRRPTWQGTLRWLGSLEVAPYRHQDEPPAAGPGRG